MREQARTDGQAGFGRPGGSPRTEVRFTADDVARLEYAASFAGQGPLGAVDPALLARLERWLRRGAPVRARLDAPTVRSLLALAPLYGAYREYRRETDAGYPRAAPPPDEAAASLEARLQAALARLQAT